jgi:hypothetical protein
MKICHKNKLEATLYGQLYLGCYYPNNLNSMLLHITSDDQLYIIIIIILCFLIIHHYLCEFHI